MRESQALDPAVVDQAIDWLVKEQIVKLAQHHKVDFFNDLYSVASASTDPKLNVLQSRFPSVPRHAIEELLADASSVEQRQMARWNFTDRLQTKPIPLRLAEELRIRHANGTFTRWLDILKNTDVLVLDDWGLVGMDAQTRTDLLEMIDDTVPGSIRQNRSGASAM